MLSRTAPVKGCGKRSLLHRTAPVIDFPGMFGPQDTLAILVLRHRDHPTNLTVRHAERLPRLHPAD
jgi:hypothetical protein